MLVGDAIKSRAVAMTLSEKGLPEPPLPSDVADSKIIILSTTQASATIIAASSMAGTPRLELDVSPPFESTWVGFEKGMRIPVADDSYFDELGVHGVLYCRGGAWVLVTLRKDDEFITALTDVDDTDVGGYLTHIRNTVINLVNHQLSIGVVERAGAVSARVMARKSSKLGIKASPSDFYIIKTKVPASGANTNTVGGGRHGYQYDVRSHKRTLVAVNPTGVLGVGWERCGEPFPQWLLDKLAERGRPPPSPGDVVAYRIVQVREHRKGPEDAPYIPAIRTVS